MSSLSTCYREFQCKKVAPILHTTNRSLVISLFKKSKKTCWTHWMIVSVWNRQRRLITKIKVHLLWTVSFIDFSGKPAEDFRAPAAGCQSATREDFYNSSRQNQLFHFHNTRHQRYSRNPRSFILTPLTLVCLTLFRHFPATITSRRDGLSVLTTSSHNNGNDTKSAATNNNPSWKVRVDATKSKVQTRVAWSRNHPFPPFLDSQSW